MLVGDLAGLLPGPVSLVQPQAPDTVDDLVVHFSSGTKWVIQAKAGRVGVSWSAASSFGKAIRQLHQGAATRQIDLSPESLDRLELAVNENAARAVVAFGSWLEKARQHVTWTAFAAASTSTQERASCYNLPRLLRTETNNVLLLFLQKLFVRQQSSQDIWRQQLRQLLVSAGLPNAAEAERAINVLSKCVSDASPYRGQLSLEKIREACKDAGVAGLPYVSSRIVPSFRVVREIKTRDLESLFYMNPVRVDRFIERPELKLESGLNKNIVVMGKPGSGKSASLIHIANTLKTRDAVVVLRGFTVNDINTLLLGTPKDPYLLIWDDVHLKRAVFADLIEKLFERRDPVQILCSSRYEEGQDMRQLSDRAAFNVIHLQDFQKQQAEEMSVVVARTLKLRIEPQAIKQFTEHLLRGDGGPLFAVAMGLSLQAHASGSIRPDDITGLPDKLVAVWRDLYGSLDSRPHLQSLLHCLRFLHEINCPFRIDLCKLLYTEVLGRTREDFRLAVELLERGHWIGQTGNNLTCHDVSLEALPIRSESFADFVDFAKSSYEDTGTTLALLRVCLVSHYWDTRPRFHESESVSEATEKRIQAVTAEGVELGHHAIASLRASGDQPDLAKALQQTALGLYYLQGTRLEDINRRRQGCIYAEESARIYRDLGAKHDQGLSLIYASMIYCDLGMLDFAETAQKSGEKPARKTLGGWVLRALQSVEEAADLFRALGAVEPIKRAARDVVDCSLLMIKAAETDEERDRYWKKYLESMDSAEKMGAYVYPLLRGQTRKAPSWTPYANSEQS